MLPEPILGSTVVVTPFDVTFVGLAHSAVLVNSTVTISVLNSNPVVAKLGIVVTVPGSAPLIFHK